MMQAVQTSHPLQKVTHHQLHDNPSASEPTRSTSLSVAGCELALLTGGGDKPYALGIAPALTKAGMKVDFIGSDDLDVPELRSDPNVRFLNLRGDQSPEAGAVSKVARVLKYYVRLIRYAATAKPRIFHLLWNNKFELFDRTILMLYYRCLGKKIVLTAHNVNIGRRDGRNSPLNRISLGLQYRLSDHIFVHTEKMKAEMVEEFHLRENKVSVIPFGINNTVANTALTIAEARDQLGIGPTERALLFFGNIAPYKGLEYLVTAFKQVAPVHPDYRLIIVGKPKQSEEHWKAIQTDIAESGLKNRVIERIEYIPDEETELYFKAADVLILPYTRIFQSGVLFLGYSFGLPVIAADVGDLKEEIIEGKTGFVFKPQDASDLARRIEEYFQSDLFSNIERERSQIKEYANERYSWGKVATIITSRYSDLLQA